MSDHDQDIPEDRRDAKAAAEAKKAAYVSAKARVAKEHALAAKQNKDRIEAERQRRLDYAKLALKLKPEHPLQQGVTDRLSNATTEQLGAMIRYCAAHDKVECQWVAVAKPVARDCMQRGYPLAMQVGIMSVPNDRDHTLDFANGSRIEFTWPGKPALPAKWPPPAAEEDHDAC